MSFSQIHRSKVFSNLPEQGLVYLKGGRLVIRPRTDVEEHFRQESNFWYLTGCWEPGFHLIMDLETQQSILFSPKYDPDHAMWCGPVSSLKELETQYGLPVEYDDALDTYLSKASCIHVLTGDHGLSAHSSKLDNRFLEKAIHNARMIKSEQEIEFMKQASDISK
jgi:Xaa-Pro dipeptidase